VVPDKQTAVEQFDMAENSPGSVAREGSLVSSADDPIMDWFKAKNSLMDSSVTADVPPIEEQTNKEQEEKLH
jgi:hypothetical protein